MLAWLQKHILANAGLKLIALAMSFLLWATYNSEPISEVGFQVPLEFTSIPSQLEISGDVPTSIRVRLRGRSALLRRLTAADLTLRLDVKDAKPGTTAVSIGPETVGAPYGATVVQVSPSEIRVTLVPRHARLDPGG